MWTVSQRSAPRLGLVFMTKSAKNWDMSTTKSPRKRSAPTIDVTQLLLLKPRCRKQKRKLKVKMKRTRKLILYQAAPGMTFIFSEDLL